LPGAFFVVGVLSYLRQVHSHHPPSSQVSGIVSKTVIDSSWRRSTTCCSSNRLSAACSNYGDIEILTARRRGINKFAKLRRPVDFKTSMLDAKEQMEQQLGRSS